VIERLTRCGKNATLLDGDILRSNLSGDLGFSKADRDTNVVRVAAVARDLVTRGEVAICALISPYRSARDQARQIVGAHQFIEVFVDASLAVCEARDTKGLYARARRGEITGLTGIDDPYEVPLAPDLVLTTVHCTVEHNVSRVWGLLMDRKCL
jgi:sulfate adenylyltransferase